MEEWASCRSSKGDFWSAISGYIYAAYYPKQSPSGSSSGSGVATDLGLAWATLGTEVRYLLLSSLVCGSLELDSREHYWPK